MLLFRNRINSFRAEQINKTLKESILESHFLQDSNNLTRTTTCIHSNNRLWTKWDHTTSNPNHDKFSVLTLKHGNGIEEEED